MTVLTHYNTYNVSDIKQFISHGRFIEYNNGLLSCLLWFSTKNNSWKFFATSNGWESFAPSGRIDGSYSSSDELDIPSAVIIDNFEKLLNSVGFKFPKATQLALC